MNLMFDFHSVPSHSLFRSILSLAGGVAGPRWFRVLTGQSLVIAAAPGLCSVQRQINIE